MSAAQTKKHIILPAQVTFWEDGTYEVRVGGALLTDGTIKRRADWMQYIRERMEEKE